MKNLIARTTFATLLLAAGSANAGTPFATAAFSGGIAGFNAWDCILTNVSTKDVEATVEIVTAGNGAVIVAAGPATVPPNATLAAYAAMNVAAFCRISGVSKKSVSVSFTAYTATFAPLVFTTIP